MSFFYLFDLSDDYREEVKMGMEVEKEHGTKFGAEGPSAVTNITDDSVIYTAAIVVAHLKKHKHYYTLLEEKVENTEQKPVDLDTWFALRPDYTKRVPLPPDVVVDQYNHAILQKSTVQKVMSVLGMKNDDSLVFRMQQGLSIEVEHGQLALQKFKNLNRDATKYSSDITQDNLVTMARIALAHFVEDECYYDKLIEMEKEIAMQHF